MAVRRELCLRLQNSPGALSRVCAVLAAERVNVVALTVEAGGALRLVADNPLRAAATLESADYVVEQRDVLFLELPNGPGALERAARLLAAADVNVEYTYASAVESQALAVVIVGVEDAQRAAARAGV